jgi:hypothetical protein
MASCEPKQFRERGFSNSNSNYIQPVSECMPNPYWVKKNNFYQDNCSQKKNKSLNINPDLNADGSFSGFQDGKWINLSSEEVYPQRNFEVPDTSTYMSLSDYRNKHEIMNSNIDLTPEDLLQIQSEFKEWGKIKNYGMFYNIETGVTHFREFAKRGNSKYRKVLMAKILSLFEFMKNPEFMEDFFIRTIFSMQKSEDGFYRKKGVTYSNVFFTTLTTDPKLYYNNKKKAWLSESKEINLFLTNIRHHYGKIEYVSVVESTKQGYPHNHLILIFKTPQEIFFYVGIDKDGNEEAKWRMQEKSNFAKFWKSPIVDVFAPETPEEVLNYLFKDMFKGTLRTGTNRTSQDNLTMALQWIFRKQAYSNSSFSEKGFLGKYLPSPTDLTKECITQTDLREEIELFSDGNYIFLGVTALKWKEGYNPPDNIPNNFQLKLNPFEIDRYCLMKFMKKLEPKSLTLVQAPKQEIKQYPEEEIETYKLIEGVFVKQ